MGTVHFARDRTTGMPVAVKVLRHELASDETFVKRFEREASAAARVASAHVAAVYAEGSAAGFVYLAMEYIDGSSLRTLADVGPFSLADTVWIGRDIAAGLAAAHAAGIVHRDLKPDNVMITCERTVKIVDFGIALVSSFEQPAVRLTKTGVRVGSPTYMSPEASRGAPLTAASDIYSLGVLLYELLAERPPFESANPMVLAGMHLQARPEPIASLRSDVGPLGLAELIDAALAKSPSDRPPAAEAHRRLSLMHEAMVSDEAPKRA
jgi:serine/threonine-protein kinase